MNLKLWNFIEQHRYCLAFWLGLLGLGGIGWVKDTKMYVNAKNRDPKKSYPQIRNLYFSNQGFQFQHWYFLSHC
jgi:hypothetical protein